MTETMIGVIGGSGLYEIGGLQGAEWRAVETPWGVPSDAILTGTLDGMALAFLFVRVFLARNPVSEGDHDHHRK